MKPNLKSLSTKDLVKKIVSIKRKSKEGITIEPNRGEKVKITGAVVLQHLEYELYKQELKNRKTKTL